MKSRRQVREKAFGVGSLSLVWVDTGPDNFHVTAGGSVAQKV